MSQGVRQFDVGEGGYISVAEASHYIVSVQRQGGAFRRCVRHGATSVPSSALGYCEWLMPPGEKAKDYRVFIFMTSTSIRESYRHAPKIGYVVARSMAVVADHLRKKWTKRVQEYSGMAKDALTLSMKKTSSAANSGSLKTGRKARRVINRSGMVEAVVTVSGQACSVRVRDDLRYAADALKGGPSMVDFCLKKAANSVNGNINSYIEKHGRSFFEGSSDFDIQKAPFPEVIGE